jgi:hydroxymethylbilane synthase
MTQTKPAAVTSSKSVIVATRKSALALAQCRAWMAELTAASGATLEELHVTTTGDRIVDRPLTEIGGKGLFVKEIEMALLDGSAHLAVHSMKDLPGELADGLVLGCVPHREDPRDVIITRSGCPFSEIPAGSKIGTSSLRRVVQLKALRPDLEFVPLRGNVDTRLRRCREGAVEAIVLAYAGLRRLGLGAEATEVLAPELCLPAIGQGALAVEVRANDNATQRLIAPLNDVDTDFATAAERGVLEAAQGNCQLPIAGYAVRTTDGAMNLRALLANPDGSALRRQQVTAPWPVSREAARALGLEVGRALKG